MIDMSQITFDVLLQLGAFVVTIVAAAIWLKSSLVKQRHEELETLADTRGQRIADLEKSVSDLIQEVANLKGQMNAIQALKATEIASEVVVQLNRLK